MKNFFDTYNLYVNVDLDVWKLPVSFVFKNISNCAWNSCFYTTNFGVTCFKIGFTICILKICEFYLNSKNFGNQKLSQDSKKSGEFLWYINFWKIFRKLGQTSRKRQRLPKLANINQWDCELRTHNEILLAEKRQRALSSSILLKHYSSCIVNNTLWSVRFKLQNH